MNLIKYLFVFALIAMLCVNAMGEITVTSVDDFRQQKEAMKKKAEDALNEFKKSLEGLSGQEALKKLREWQEKVLPTILGTSKNN
uniref:Putative secreted salivary protein n=1 Tax=Xenopsylla cheopis TaxID=163159 RepID=A2IAA8_XENCH|nr:putative secreted salivary protein [Xenopsylla cheopis]